MKGKKTIFCGDIGCYTLGNAMPLDMVDTCLCMGAGLNIAQGVEKVEPDTTCFAFVGDSTFLHLQSQVLLMPFIIRPIWYSLYWITPQLP